MATTVLERLQGIAEIQKAVESDLAGNPKACKGQIDGEAIAGLMSYVASSLDQAGGALGLGSMKSMLIQGPDINCVTFVRGETVTSCFLGARASAVKVQRNVERHLG